MKPIPVKSNRSERRSWICQFIIITAITLCTLGFLGTIAGITYLEVFANKSLTSYETSEKPVDLSGITLDSRQTSESHDHDYRMGTEETKAEHHTVEETKSKVISESLDENEMNEEISDFKKSVTELNQYINSAQSKIKFEDGETVIYEVKPDHSIEYEKSSHVLDGFKGRILEDFDSFESNKSVDKDGSEVNEAKQDEKLGNIETDSQSPELQDKFVAEDEGNFHLHHQDLTSSETHLKLDSEETASEELKPVVKFTGPSDSTKINEAGAINPDRAGVIGPNPETNVIHEEKIIETIDKVGNNKAMFGENGEESQRKYEDYLSLIEEGEDDKPIAGDHDVNLMVEVVDDPEEQVVNAFASRNGDIHPTQTENSISRSTSVKAETEPSVKQENEPQVSTHSQTTTEFAPPKSTVDMRVSLAEAMKHLQVLDSNKILGSRTKPKPKKEATRKRKPSSSRQKDQDSERMRYLQKVRLMLYEHLK